LLLPYLKDQVKIGIHEFIEKRFSIKTLLEALPLLFKEGTEKVASFMWGQNQRKYEGKK
jgi:hypothetical protein